jgi:hypothetical protein
MRSDVLNKIPFAPVVGGMFGLVAGILVMATPLWLFEQTVVSTGFPGLISAAAPPLGDKARIMTAILAIAIVGGLLTVIIAQIERLTTARTPIPRGTMLALPAPIALTVAPRPIFAEQDLGAPFMSDEAVAHARGELLLDSEMIAESPEAGGGEPAIVERRTDETVGSMLIRLEDALERRRERAGDTAPVPGDIRSLRSALGMVAA